MSRDDSLPPEAELSERFIQAGGPGGQHVNTSATAVQPRFDAAASDWLSEPVRRRLLRLAGNRADGAGVITITVRSHRSQHANRREARERLASLIERARKPPRKRVATRVPNAARRKRLEAKRHRSRIKRRRKAPGPED